MAAKGNELHINTPAPGRNEARMARLELVIAKRKESGLDTASFEAELQRRRRGEPKQPKEKLNG